MLDRVVPFSPCAFPWGVATFVEDREAAGSPSFPTFSSSVSLNIVQDKDGCLLKHLLMKDLVTMIMSWHFILRMVESHWHLWKSENNQICGGE